MVKQPTIVNTTSHTPTIILLILNLIATIALLGHVFYYIPSATNAAATDGATAEASDAGAPKQLLTDGVGFIGLDNTNRVQFDLIKLADGGQPEVLQKVTVTQEGFLDSLQRFSEMRQRLEDKELIRRTEE